MSSECKTNKEIINSLCEYFYAQDHKVICRLLANMMIDMNRIHKLKHLPIEEKTFLFQRIERNVKELEKFIHNGPEGNLALINLGEKDER